MTRKRSSPLDGVAGTLTLKAYRIALADGSGRMALDACAGVRPRDGDAVLHAIESAVTEITEKFQLGSKVRELTTKFLAVKTDVPFTEEKTGARARYYADLEETRALKAQASKKPVRPQVSPGSDNGS